MIFLSNSFSTNSANSTKLIIPPIYTCDGTNETPHFSWSGEPQLTQSFAILIDDPDSPNPPNWCHLLLFNIPSSIHEIPEGSLKKTQYPFGWNSWSRGNYGGPCPPSGEHEYVFHLFALNRMLPEMNPENGESWMRDTFLYFIQKNNSVLAQNTFSAYYKRIN
jgi:Raf kinase inhibitor-like YbhB/YbcL family protein